MIPASELKDRMATCDNRLFNRISLDIERAMIDAADVKAASINYQFRDTVPMSIRDKICDKLKKSGYTVIDGGLYTVIVWSLQ